MRFVTSLKKQIALSLNSVVPKGMEQCHHEGRLACIWFTQEDRQALLVQSTAQSRAEQPLDEALKLLVAAGDLIEEALPALRREAGMVLGVADLGQKKRRRVLLQLSRSQVNDTVLDVEEPWIAVEILWSDRNSWCATSHTDHQLQPVTILGLPLPFVEDVGIAKQLCLVTD